MDYSPPDSSVYGILQARILEWVPVLFSRGSFQPRDQTQFSYIASRFFYHLSHQGSPRTLEWVAYPFFSGNSWPRNGTRVSCIAGRFFTSWTTREAHSSSTALLISSASKTFMCPHLPTCREPGVEHRTLYQTCISRCVTHCSPWRTKNSTQIRPISSHPCAALTRSLCILPPNSECRWTRECTSSAHQWWASLVMLSSSKWSSDYFLG